MYPHNKRASHISQRNLVSRRSRRHGRGHTCADRAGYLLTGKGCVTMLCAAHRLSRVMGTDAVEVPRMLADTEKTVKLYRLKVSIKFGSIVK